LNEKFIVPSDFRQANQSFSAATTHAVNLTQLLQDCNARADLAELRFRSAVQGGDAMAHVVKDLKATVIAVEQGFNNSIAAAVREAAACNVALDAAHNRSIVTVFLIFIGPCTLTPITMFVLVLCSRGSAPSGRVWLLVSKVLVLTAYSSWVIPHIIDPSILNPRSHAADTNRPIIWAETLQERLFSQLPPLFSNNLPQSPAHFFVIGSCAFALSLAVQGPPSLAFSLRIMSHSQSSHSFSGYSVIRSPSPALVMDLV
jgi:hypothetical protein